MGINAQRPDATTFGISTRPVMWRLLRIFEIYSRLKTRILMLVQATLRSDRAVAHGSEGAFNGIGRPQRFPVLGRGVVERQERVPILAQAVGSAERLGNAVGIDDHDHRASPGPTLQVWASLVLRGSTCVWPHPSRVALS
jgi:hypothetical protein